MPDYSRVDSSHLLDYIFYPRSDFSAPPPNAFDVFVTVEPGIDVSCRFYTGAPQWPLIFYFHGNGEVVSDYDHIASYYNQQGLNLAVADYRGYGASGGSPTLTALSADCHLLLEAVKQEISKRQYKGGLWVMGRSLGSLSALELASRSQDSFRGLIIESGFASILTVMQHLGLSLQPEGASELITEQSIDVVRSITLPALLIHGQDDSLVPLGEAETLYEHLRSARKELVVIPAADHNDVFFAGMHRYFEALKGFIAST